MAGSFEDRIKELLAQALDPDPEPAAGPEKLAAEEAGKSLADLLEGQASVLEKIASMPFLASYEAAQAATARSVDATNTPIGDLLNHKPKAPEPLVDALKLAKKGSDASSSERLRQALIARLREAGVVEPSKEAPAATTAVEAAPAAAAEETTTGTIKKVAADLRALAGRVRQLEAAKVAAETSVADMARHEQAGKIAKVAAQRGFIEEGHEESYAASLLEDKDLDLGEQFDKIASATPRIPFGVASERPIQSGSAEGRLLNRLTRNG